MVKLVVHAGPMKTGSTYLQLHLQKKANVFREHGIECRVFRIQDVNDACVIGSSIKDALNNSPETILISSEFFAVKSNKKWLDHEIMKPLNKIAVVICRPLIEVYKSFYLQTIRGAFARVQGFEGFVRKQMEHDYNPSISRMTFNYEYIERKLESEGFEVRFIQYSKNQLMNDFIQEICDVIPDVPFSDIILNKQEIQLESMKGQSPLRSLSMSMAPIGIAINKLYRNGRLSSSDRNFLMTKLVKYEENLEVIQNETLRKHIVDFDYEINGQFYIDKGFKW